MATLSGALVLGLVLGCGRAGFDPLDGGNIDAARDAAVDAPTPANIMFVTSTTQVAATLGLAGADATCASLASAAHLPGTFVAWLSTSTQSAAQRLGSARGWRRPDGKPFADQVADIVNGRILYPPRIDETDAVVTTTHVATGTASGTAAMTCTDFSSTVGTVTSGDPSLTALFSSALTDSCATPLRLYCFQIDHVASVVPDPAGLRHAFVSSIWLPTGGVAAADGQCQTDAMAGGLPGTYRALIATTTATAASRFDLTGPAWARVDGAVLAASPAALMAANLDTPLDLDSKGNYTSIYPAHNIWSGAPTPTAVGTTATCGDWTGTLTGLEGEDFSLGATFFSDGGMASCNQGGRHVYCLER